MTVHVRTIPATIDGGQVTLLNGVVRDRALRIPAGAYTTPFWLRTPAGLVTKVSRLPWQGAMPTGQLEVLSTEPDWPAADVLFHSDWSTDLGVTDAALRDTGKAIPWDAPLIGGGTWDADETAIIAATGLDFPASMANVLRSVCKYDGDDTSPSRIMRYAGMPVIGVGESRYFRSYVRYPATLENFPSGFDELWHIHQDGTASSGSNWEFEVVADTLSEPLAGGVVRQRMWIKQTLAPNSGHIRFYIDLPLGATYRHEWAVHRLATNEWSMQARIYDSAGTLLYDEDDYESISGGAPVYLGDVTTAFTNASNTNGLNAGHNGVNLGMNSVGADFIHTYQGGVCIRSADWCGAYRNGA